ncbi:MAG TPA: AMP-binding protein [Bacillota bacterium]|nr:AMP-binding protein [Bacillota bacterium]
MNAEIRQRIETLLAKYPVWQRRTIGDHFDRVVEKYGDRYYILAEEAQYTYSQVKQLSDRLARGLIAMGIRPREHVALLMGNYPEFAIIVLALVKIGAVCVPINPVLNVRELGFVLRDSDAVALIANDRLGKTDYSKILAGLFAGCLGEGEGEGFSPGFPLLRNVVLFSPESREYPGVRSLNSLMELGDTVSEDERRRVQRETAYPDDTCFIMYTSGTTAEPKGVMLTHDMLLRGAYASCLARAAQDGRRIYFPIPFYHIFAIEQAFLFVTFVGGAMIPHLQFAPQSALALMEKYRANDFLCVPTILLSILNCPELDRFDLSSLTAVLCASTPAPLPLWKRARDELKLTELSTGYGMTEVAGAGVLSWPGDDIEILATRVGRMMYGGSSGLEEFGGRNIQYKVVDPFTGRDLPPGSEGELACRGNIVTRGYYKRPQENAALIDKDGWLRTGDMGIIHPDGLLQLTGRSKEMYKTSGENVVPKEVEEYISTYHKVNQVYVVGVPHQVMGDVGVAFIELKPGEECTRREIIEHCRRGLAKFKVPRYFFFVRGDELPFTSSGKVQKYKLVEEALRRIKKGG